MEQEEKLEFIKDICTHWRKKLHLEQEAEDIAQDVVVKLLEKGKWDVTKGYLAKAAKHYCIDLKRQGVEKMAQLDEKIPCPTSLRDELDRRMFLDKALKKFTWVEQKAVRLRLQGVKLKTIAKETGLSLSRAQAIIDETAQELNRLWVSR